MRIVAIAFVLMWAITAEALAPRYIPDDELAGFPIIVVAKWEKAPFRAHHRYTDDGRGVTAIEAFTSLRVIRVIKGDAKAGVCALKVGAGIAWSSDGAWVRTGTSTNLRGDVDDITKPCIWFLRKQRSWDAKDRTEYVSISNYRAIQPLFLEKYFDALGSKDPRTEVPKLLTSKNPQILRRVLRYVCGGILPWPNEPDEFGRMYLNPDKRRGLLSEEAPAVRKVIDSDLDEVRALAVSVYAKLEGRRSIEYMRSLLGDRAPDVRGTAVGILARYRDEASIPAMSRAVKGIHDGRISCRVIEALASWGDSRFLPMLIPFLENDKFVHCCGDDVGIPAIRARQAIHAISGHWFPYDVKRSGEAWGKAKSIVDPKERQKVLHELLPGREFPFGAELTGQPRRKAKRVETAPAPESRPHVGADGPRAGREDESVEVTVKVKNVSGEPMTIARLPTAMHQTWNGFSYRAFGRFDRDKGKSDFVTLKPGQSIEFKAELDRSFLLAEPASRRLSLLYREMGGNIGLNAWIGALRVTYGSDWKEERRIDRVEEKWANGNLRAVGQTVNGERFGEWHFFNQEGDRIEIVYYHSGAGMTTCNPDHPDNKGAGKRPGDSPTTGGAWGQGTSLAWVVSTTMGALLLATLVAVLARTLKKRRPSRKSSQ